MKRKERHHLKENELAHTIESAREFLETRQRQIAGVAVGIVVVVVAIIGFVVYRQQTQSRGSELLAEAMVALNARVVPTGARPERRIYPRARRSAPPERSRLKKPSSRRRCRSSKSAADAYPDSACGITARYHMAGALAALGRHQDAIKDFDEVAEAKRRHEPVRPDGSSWQGRHAGALRPTRRGDRHVEGDDRRRCRRSARGRDPDGAGSRLRAEGQHRRSEEDVHRRSSTNIPTRRI